MADSSELRKAIDGLVNSALESRMAELRTNLVDQLIAKIGSAQVAGTGHAPGSSPTDLLNGAIQSLQSSTTQTDILRSLVEGTAQFCSRAALLVVRGSSAQGWQARGFSEDHEVRLVTVDCGKGVAARVLESFLPAAGSFHDLSGNIGDHATPPRDGNVLLLPLIIKDKVAALVYADGGDSGNLDGSALEVLVRSAAIWLELLTLRKAAGITTDTSRRAAHAEAPVAAHHDRPAAATASVAAPETQPGAVQYASESADNGNGNAAASVMEDELHNKARRFAKLLVDEIKLYNQSKVSEGKQARDLYVRLKDDIEKSRATYERRYGQIGDVDYFRQELVRVLADNDPSLLGANFVGQA